MRKIALLLVVQVILSSNVYAQLRFVDIRCHFETPEDGESYLRNDTIHFTYWLVNQGPDSLYAEDSVISYPIFSPHPVGYKARRSALRLNKGIGVGDSLLINDWIKLEVHPSINAFNLQFSRTSPECKSSIPYLGPNFLMSESTADRIKDNGDRVSLKVNTASMDNLNLQKISIYPNPVGKNQPVYLSVEDVSKIEQIRLYNNLGQLVIHKNQNNLEQFILAPETPGLYKGTLATEKKIFTFNLVVQ